MKSVPPQKTKNKKNDNRESNPVLQHLTLPLTSKLPSRHDKKQEEFDYAIIISFLLVIESTTNVFFSIEVLFK